MERLNQTFALGRRAALAAAISVAVAACGSTGDLDETASDAAAEPTSIDSVARDVAVEPESTLADPDAAADVDHETGVGADGDATEDRYVCDGDDPHYMEIDIFFPTDAVYYRVRGPGERSVELTEEFADWEGRFIVYEDVERLSIDRDGSFVVQAEHDVSFWLTGSREIAFARDVNDDDELLIVTEPQYFEWYGWYFAMTPLVFDESGLVRWVRYCTDDDDYFEEVQRAVADVGFADADPAERIVRGVEQLAVSLWEEGQADLERSEAEAGDIRSPGLFAPEEKMVHVALEIDVEPSAGRLVCFDQSDAELDGRFCVDVGEEGKQPVDMYVAAGERVLVTVGVETDGGIETEDEVLEIAVSDLVESDVVIGSETTDGQHRLVVRDAP